MCLIVALPFHAAMSRRMKRISSVVKTQIRATLCLRAILIHDVPLLGCTIVYAVLFAIDKVCAGRVASGAALLALVALCASLIYRHTAPKHQQLSARS